MSLITTSCYTSCNHIKVNEEIFRILRLLADHPLSLINRVTRAVSATVEVFVKLLVEYVASLFLFHDLHMTYFCRLSLNTVSGVK